MRGVATLPARKTADAKPREVILVSGFDRLLFMAVVLLILVGIVMVFSSSYYTSATSARFNYDMFMFLKKQVTAVGVGAIVMLFMSVFNYHNLRVFAFLMYIISNGLLVVVRLVGEPVNGAYRWLDVPVFGSFQPSEFAKVALVIFLAAYISGTKDAAKSLRGILGCIMIVALPCLLVLWGKNLSTAIILCGIGFSMVFVASPYFWPFVILLGSGVAGLWSALEFLDLGYQSDRYAAWKNPFSDPLGKGFQTIQSLYAVASGGLFGLGIGNSKQKLIFMPEPHNDFIFSIICEELGFFGAVIVLFLFAVLVWRGFRIAMNAQDTFGSLIVSGAMVMIAVQVVINVAVVTNTIPNTGIPLPFISYGGTSIVFLMFLMGVVLNISKFTAKT